MPDFDITVKHPIYQEFIDSWCLMRDAVAGEDKIKLEGEKYLPMKSGMRVIENQTDRLTAYMAYQSRAEFPELVSPTILGSTGLIHNTEPTYDVPPAMADLLENITKDGKTLADFHREVTTEVLTTGRFGILPGVRADGTFYLSGYCTERIVNWDDHDGKTNFVVLDESRMARNPDNNQWELDNRYLELSLDDKGGYQAREYSGDLKVASDPIGAVTPKKEPLNEIPFVFCNVTNLDQNPDDVPLYGLAKIAVRIYRLDADYTHGLHMTSEPTPYATGFDNPKRAVDDGLAPRTIGASTIWLLPKSGTAGFLEFSGPGLDAQAKAIGAALERAVLFGAQILSDENRSAESGESRKLRLRTQNSLLSTVNKNTCAAIQKALRNIATWMGIDPELVTVTPPDDLTDYTLSAQELTALVSGWQSGAYSKDTLFFNVKRAGMIPEDRNFEEEEALIETETPPLGSIPPALPGNTPPAPNGNGNVPNDPNNPQPNGGTDPGGTGN